MILMLDNYDSFTYNLYQLIGSVREDIKVVRNDAMTLEEIEEMAPEAIIISPGPGRPEDAGVCMDAIKYFKGRMPILGICLGHQAICAAYGGTVSYAKELMHGKTSPIEVSEDTQLFKNIEGEIEVARYHSLAALKETLSDELKVTAWTADDEVMAVEDQVNKVFGIQFHPESVLTPKGKAMIENFFSLI